MARRAAVLSRAAPGGSHARRRAVFEARASPARGHFRRAPRGVERVQPFQEIAAHLHDQHARRDFPLDLAGGKQIGELFADRRVDLRLFGGGQAWARRHGPDPIFWRRGSLGGVDDHGNWTGSLDARGRRDATAAGRLDRQETARSRDGLYARHDIWRANRRHAGASWNPNRGVARLRERLGGGFARAGQGGVGIGVDSRNPVARRRDETMRGAGFLRYSLRNTADQPR